tara:strand:+ start:6400 stop:7104 length:705 start_codon:yes stop_codon:yes gene_type:complete
MSNIKARLSDMQDLADKLADISSQLEDGTSLLGEWKELADEYEPDDITCKLDALEEWECLETTHGDVDDIETKLTELVDWVGRVEDSYGDVGTVVDKLDSIEQWEDIERNHGDADDVERKLGEAESLYVSYGDADYIGETLDRWAQLETDFGTVDDIRSILKHPEGARHRDYEELKTLLAETHDKVEELEAAGTSLGEDFDEMHKLYCKALGELEVLKNRSRWQTFLSLFTGGN